MLDPFAVRVYSSPFELIRHFPILWRPKLERSSNELEWHSSLFDIRLVDLRGCASLSRRLRDGVWAWEIAEGESAR